MERRQAGRVVERGGAGGWSLSRILFFVVDRSLSLRTSLAQIGTSALKGAGAVQEPGQLVWIIQRGRRSQLHVSLLVLGRDLSKFPGLLVSKGLY